MLEGVEFLFCDVLSLVVAGDIDVDDAAGVDVWWQENGREFNLRDRVNRVNGEMRSVALPYQAFVFCQEHSDSSVDLADC